MIRRPPRSTLFPSRRSSDLFLDAEQIALLHQIAADDFMHEARSDQNRSPGDRKSTRLNSSHITISYAVFCLKKKKSITSWKWNPKRLYGTWPRTTNALPPFR